MLRAFYKKWSPDRMAVIALMPEGSEAFGREVLYTAVTRARKGIQWDAAPTVIEAAVATRARKMSGISRDCSQNKLPMHKIEVTP